MRGRLIAMGMVLAILAFAEIRHETQTPVKRLQIGAATSQLADSPPPAPDAPTSITAAVSAAATAQTLIILESRREVNPAFTVSTVGLRPTLVPFRAGKPRSFPLLI